MHGQSINLATYNLGTITQQAASAGKKFADTVINANDTVKTSLMVIGGIVVFVCVGLILARKVFPQTTIGQMVQGNGGMMFIICGISLGVVCFAPATILPILASLFAIIPDLAIFAFDKLTGGGLVHLS
ncbi:MULTISPECIES: hypothetical protein [Bifidobacterium]|jgi:hypothetical protein|uniref:Uncharacterized protein n=1 Tax=Bifidobacterium tibiigranuli TaxID=2172043 RepID=A0A5N6S1T5_9BIFI|nr:hypothetical protein [Bifidobacterium tibiigranuli]KAE8128422.1 hypothetical protein DDE84_05935 [Bifidobacterium tibiigranuli]KAE8128562.1 hypothetical protein DDF78_05410 [Bifidobacterium tibiigranuli]MCH3974954.1 hypothetical protein [Bifidobacterium tibiigranuli]MCH4189175.1 hypothetical protein [Bifidobacterium tibiigranuli]MCH4202714.1 hypothetical protein [Bifidobacterium tibiigranuli]